MTEVVTDGSKGAPMPVSRTVSGGDDGGMLYAPKLSTRSKRKQIKETGNEEE